MPDSIAPSAAPSRRPSLPTARPSVITSRRASIATATSTSPTHSSQHASPSLSRKSSVSLSTASTSSTANTARGSRSHSISKAQHPHAAAAKPLVQLPPYVQFINAYMPSQPLSHHPTGGAASASPFLSSPLYTLTPHETSLLFQHYITPAATSTAAGIIPKHSLARTDFAALVLDWLQQLRRRASDGSLTTAGGGGSRPATAAGAGVVLESVVAAIDAVIAEVGAVADQLFTTLDANGNECVERDEFKLFLASVDALVGGRIRAEWKRAIVVPRLKAIAAL